MKKFLFFACVAACGVRPNSLHVLDLSSTLAELESNTKQSWQVRYQPDLSSVALLTGGRTQPLATNLATAKQAAINFVMQYRALFGLVDGNDNMVVTGGEQDALGDMHVRLGQARGSLVVWGSGLIVHFASDGSIYEVNGAAFALPPLVLTPAVASADARTAAITAAQMQNATLDPGAIKTTTPTLIVLPTGTAQALLAYAVDVENTGAGDPFHSVVLIDAQSGAVVRVVNKLLSLSGQGEGYFGELLSFEVTQRDVHFYLDDPTRGDIKTYTAAGSTALPGDEISSVNADVWEPRVLPKGVGVAVHAYVAQTYDYFANVHGQIGWAATVAAIRSTTHFGNHVVNAFYDGHQLIFGDGDGATYLPPGAALSMVAHEYTHGWLDNGVRLSTDGDSAILHEAFADVFAALVTSSANESTPWQIGWRTRLVNGANEAVRDVANPIATGNPATLADRQTTDDPHVNSTILSHVAYLMATGTGSDMAASLGVATTEKIWYRAAAHYLTPSANFDDAADALYSAALDLDPTTVPAVQAALGAVGLAAP